MPSHDWWEFKVDRDHPHGPGRETWRGFGRKVFFGFLFFLTMATLVVVGLVFLVTSLITSASDGRMALLIPALVLLGLVLLGKRFFGVAFVALFVTGIVLAVSAVASQVSVAGQALLIPLLVAIGVLVIGRRAVRTWRPVRSLIDAAGSLADGDYSVRVSPGGSAQTRSIVSSFNDMAERLETADELRRRLLADLGHELRTPLTVIRGEVEAMIDGVHTMDEEHLEMLIAEVEIMERLLEDLRTLSLLEAGTLSLHPEPTDLGELLEDVGESFRRRADEAAMVLSIDTGAEVGELMLDPVRMREVLGNVVINALRAMPNGGALRIRVDRMHDGAAVTVVDTGVGIAEEELDRVFDRFHKGSESAGSGLGLTISRDLVEAHGGTMSISSEVGVGTTVRIELPGPKTRLKN